MLGKLARGGTRAAQNLRKPIPAATPNFGHPSDSHGFVTQEPGRLLKRFMLAVLRARSGKARAAKSGRKDPGHIHRIFPPRQRKRFSGRSEFTSRHSRSSHSRRIRSRRCRRSRGRWCHIRNRLRRRHSCCSDSQCSMRTVLRQWCPGKKKQTTKLRPERWPEERTFS